MGEPAAGGKQLNRHRRQDPRERTRDVGLDLSGRRPREMRQQYEQRDDVVDERPRQ